MAARHKPQRLGDLVPGVLQAVRRNSRPVACLQQRWTRLVGPELAGHTKPVSLRRGRLIVHAEQPGDSYALQFQREAILKRVRRASGGRVEELVVRIGDV